MSHQNIDHGQTTHKEDSIPTETSPSISATGSVQSDLEIKASSLSTSFEQSIPFGYKVKLAETEFMSDTELNTRYTHPKRRWLHSKDYSSLSRHTKSTDNSETSIFSKASLPLTPFSNQVGGHAVILRFSDKALCKQLDAREKSFYENVGVQFPDLLEFMATYMGVVNVSFCSIKDQEKAPVLLMENNQHLFETQSDEDGGSSPENSFAYSLPNKLFDRKMQNQIVREAISPVGVKSRFTQLKSINEMIKGQWDSTVSNADESAGPGTDEGIFQMDDMEYSLNPQLPAARSSTATEEENDDTTPPESISILGALTPSQKPPIHVNPWSAHLYNTKMSDIQTENTTDTRQFLLLEDLTAGLAFPCILDLKMGTRQYGVRASPEKKASQERKCERSTSKKLGVRLCGMQLYKNDTKQYKYMDKYLGRLINVGAFKHSVLSFFDNGTHYLMGHIRPILEQLYRLLEIIRRMGSSRLYASSLLIFYDGDMNSTREAKIKMIDFANCLTQIPTDALYPPTTSGPDHGFMKGLETLIKILEEIRADFAGYEKDLAGHVPKLSMSVSQKASVELSSRTL